MTITTEQTQALHAAYCKATKLDIKFTSYHMYVWERFIFDGHTQEELELVCKWLWYLVKKGERTMRTFAFQSLIRDEPRFLDDLAQARGWSRTPKTDLGRDSALRATGRPAMARETKSTNVAQVMENHKQMAAMLAEWRRENL